MITNKPQATGPACPRCGRPEGHRPGCDWIDTEWSGARQTNKPQTPAELTAKLTLLMADLVTMPPDSDRLRQISNTAAELRRCIAQVGEFAEDAENV